MSFLLVACHEVFAFDSQFSFFFILSRGVSSSSADSGSGVAFSAGHDLSEMVGRDLPFYQRLFDSCTELMETIHQLISRTDEETLRFFRVHESADVEHSAVCRQLLDRLPENEKAEAVAAGEELAGALWNFLSGVEARASIH